MLIVDILQLQFTNEHAWCCFFVKIGCHFRQLLCKQKHSRHFLFNYNLYIFSFVIFFTTECKSDPVDLIFLLDSSSSEGSRNFRTQLKFVHNFTQDFDIGPTAVQVGVVTFSTHVQNRIWLNSYRSKRALLNAIDRIPYLSGVTHTGQGLQFVRQVALR